MYNYGTEYYYDSDPSAIFAEVASVLVSVYLVALIFAIVCYVFQSLGLYAIAKRRGHQRPWLAWIPIANSWLTGRLADQYQWIAKGRRTNRAKILLYLEIGLLATAIVLLALVFTTLVSTQTEITFGSDMEILLEDAAAATGVLMIVSLLYLAISALSIIYYVFCCMSLYDIFASCDPDKKVLFIVLSILFGIHPFFIFALRNKDLGMHPQYPPHNMYNQGGYNNYGGFNNNDGYNNYGNFNNNGGYNNYGGFNNNGGYNNYGGFNNNGGYNNYGNFNNNGGYNPNNFNQNQSDPYNQNNQDNQNQYR